MATTKKPAGKAQGSAQQTAGWKSVGNQIAALRNRIAGPTKATAKPAAQKPVPSRGNFAGMVRSLPGLATLRKEQPDVTARFAPQPAMPQTPPAQGAPGTVQIQPVGVPTPVMAPQPVLPFSSIGAPTAAVAAQFAMPSPDLTPLELQQLALWRRQQEAKQAQALGLAMSPVSNVFSPAL